MDRPQVKKAAAFLAIALVLLAVSVHHALTTPWHPTDEQIIEAMVKDLNVTPQKLHQSRQPLPAIIWRT